MTTFKHNHQWRKMSQENLIAPPHFPYLGTILYKKTPDTKNIDHSTIVESSSSFFTPNVINTLNLDKALILNDTMDSQELCQAMPESNLTEQRISIPMMRLETEIELIEARSRITDLEFSNIKLTINQNEKEKIMKEKDQKLKEKDQKIKELEELIQKSIDQQKIPDIVKMKEELEMKNQQIEIKNLVIEDYEQIHDRDQSEIENLRKEKEDKMIEDLINWEIKKVDKNKPNEQLKEAVRKLKMKNEKKDQKIKELEELIQEIIDQQEIPDIVKMKEKLEIKNKQIEMKYVETEDYEIIHGRDQSEIENLRKEKEDKMIEELINGSNIKKVDYNKANQPLEEAVTKKNKEIIRLKKKNEKLEQKLRIRHDDILILKINHKRNIAANWEKAQTMRMDEHFSLQQEVGIVANMLGHRQNEILQAYCNISSLRKKINALEKDNDELRKKELMEFHDAKETLISGYPHNEDDLEVTEPFDNDGEFFFDAINC